ncbi:DUF4097 family beta strand repeat-containing protein [Paenibacillus sp. JX-17]|uniref:DUF4097 family beta strand repeat-containing protein n=1 Tax=Paenibacillus lacisoli TaxID=3064525 RepID=A0ABT9CB24_9BACL|nr:DUF4097 family beta strand repeat-containing protein [Paenibacillus sp. JX-17]MDO7904813.1 DUF4097 family beta strand repeat-containing protein [Paenibacillus sp. JX-17]
MKNNRKLCLIGIMLIVLSFAGTGCQPLNVVDKLPAHEQKWTFVHDELNALVINSEYDVNLEFIASPDDTNFVEISGNLQQSTINQLKEIEITGNALNLQLQKDVKLVAPNYKSIKTRIIVALADDTKLKQISFTSSSGNTSFTGLKAGMIDLSVSSGNLRAEAITAGRLSLTSKSGNITAERIQADTEIQLHSGDIKVDGVKGSLTMQSTSGSITAVNVNGSTNTTLHSGNIKFDRFTGNGVFKSVSGNVTLTGLRSDSLDISIRTGNVTLSPDPQFKGFFDLKTTSGHITAPESPQETTDIIKVRAASGDIRIR